MGDYVVILLLILLYLLFCVVVREWDKRERARIKNFRAEARIESKAREVWKAEERKARKARKAQRQRMVCSENHAPLQMARGESRWVPLNLERLSLDPMDDEDSYKRHRVVGTVGTWYQCPQCDLKQFITEGGTIISEMEVMQANREREAEIVEENAKFAQMGRARAEYVREAREAGRNSPVVYEILGVISLAFWVVNRDFPEPMALGWTSGACFLVAVVMRIWHR